MNVLNPLRLNPQRLKKKLLLKDFRLFVGLTFSSFFSFLFLFRTLFFLCARVCIWFFWSFSFFGGGGEQVSGVAGLQIMLLY